MTTYSVSGDVATAMPGQTCNVTTEAGVSETLTVMNHTLRLNAGDTTLTSSSSETIDKGLGSIG